MSQSLLPTSQLDEGRQSHGNACSPRVDPFTVTDDVGDGPIDVLPGQRSLRNIDVSPMTANI